MKARVTLADLSRETGLSQATISMILARRTDVSFSDATVRRVHAAARRLGYEAVTRKRLTLFARKTVMVVCPFLLNHYYSAVVQTLQMVAARMQCNVLVYTTYNNAQEESRILKVMAESEIGGIIFAMMPQSKNLLRRIAKTVPIVVIADEEGDLPVEFVNVRNHKSGILVAKHLAELGHKDIVCISTPDTGAIPARKYRFEGIQDTWKKLCPNGSARLFTHFASPCILKESIYSERYLGQQVTESLLENEPDSFTAVVGLNDMLAYGVLDAMQHAGKRVPQDYSVCGCDNDFPSDLVGVNLTSVEHFMAQNAQLAFRALYKKMSEEEFSSEILGVKDIQPELIPRSSTGIPRTTP